MSKQNKFHPSLSIKRGGELGFSSEAFGRIAEAVLKRGQTFRFQVKGTSMTPFILNNDILSAVSFSDNSPTIGEVVIFLSPHDRRCYIHRVIKTRENSVLLKGDRESNYDGFIPLEYILGKIIRIERQGRDKHFEKRSKV